MKQSHHLNEYSFRSFVKDTLSDLEGHWCAKRVTIAIGVGLFVTAFFANTFFHYTVDSAIMGVITTIIVSGLAVTGAERFGKGFDDNDHEHDHDHDHDHDMQMVEPK